MTDTARSRPLDAALRARLHLTETSRVRLGFVRAALQSVDAASRAILRKPFFALREAEDLLEQLGGQTGGDLVRAILRRNGGTRIVPHGLDHIPTGGPVIIAATHPTGMFDFLAHAGALLERRPDLKVVANQETEPFLGSDCIVPVTLNKQNRATSARATQRDAARHLADQSAILIFGSGRVPSCKDGQLVEPDWRSGASRLSQQFDVPVVPAALDARNSRMYYCVRKLAQMVSGGDDNVGAIVASLRYASEILENLGGQFDVFYGAPLRSGTPPHLLKASAERLVPGLYAPG